MKIGNSKYFSVFGLFWIGLGFLGVILSFLGIFYNWIIAIYGIGGIIFLLWIFKKSDFKISKDFWIILIVFLIFISTLSFFTTPTIFSGRDQGTLSETAIRLAQNHRLEFSFPASEEFFKIYGSGKALNFPGFSYTKEGNLITQFPVGYSSWLASFYSVFGLNGFILANVISFLIFIFSFYFLSRIFFKKKSAVLSLVFIFSSFIFSWFFKFTLSENLAWALVWFGILQFVVFLRDNDKFYLLSSFLSFGLLVFARIEALAFILMAFIVLFYKNRKNFKNIFNKKITIALILIAVLYIANFFINKEFFISLVKSQLKHFNQQDVESSAGFFSSFLHLMKIFFAYGIFNFLILGILGITRCFKSKKYEILIPFIIVLPSFIYLLDPSISSDHPWMLRRFVFSIVPALIFYSIFFLEWFSDRRPKFFYLLVTLLMATNLIVSAMYFSFSPHQNLLKQIEEISQNFKNTDLILVDKNATGDGWSMMSGPINFLFGKQSVYFFNQKDLEKIDLKKFSAVYFIIPDENVDFYVESEIFDKLSTFKNYEIENNILEIPKVSEKTMIKNSIDLPMRQKLITYGKIYLLKK